MKNFRDVLQEKLDEDIKQVDKTTNQIYNLQLQLYGNRHNVTTYVGTFIRFDLDNPILTLTDGDKVVAGYETKQLQANANTSIIDFNHCKSGLYLFGKDNQFWGTVTYYLDENGIYQYSLADAGLFGEQYLKIDDQLYFCPTIMEDEIGITRGSHYLITDDKISKIYQQPAIDMEEPTIMTVQKIASQTQRKRNVVFGDDDIYRNLLQEARAVKESQEELGF